MVSEPWITLLGIIGFRRFTRPGEGRQLPGKAERLSLDTNEQRLVRLCQRGDQVAFEQIVRLHARVVYARVALDCRDKAIAEDLSQEVFLRAWRSIAFMEDTTRFMPWLMRIAQSVTADWARKMARKKRKGKMDPAAEVAELPDSQQTPEQAMIRQEELDKAMTVMKGLPDRCRQVMAMRYLADADAQSIQVELKLTPGALRGLLHRGLEIMRQKLGVTLERKPETPWRRSEPVKGEPVKERARV